MNMETNSANEPESLNVPETLENPQLGSAGGISNSTLQ